MEAQTKSTNKGVWIILALLFVLLFYWFAIRPSNIRSQCRENSINNSILYVNHGGGAWEFDTAKRAQAQERLAAKLYDGCLHEKGLQ